MKIFMIFFASILWVVPANASPVPIATLETVQTLVSSSDVVLIDNRPPALFQQGHIPGAINLPYKRSEFEESVMTKETLEQFKGKTLVFYCSGNKTAFNASAQASEWGWSADKIYWFKDGFPAWAANGLTVETTKTPDETE